MLYYDCKKERRLTTMTYEEYKAELEKLDMAEFLANMSDDYQCWKNETEWINKRRLELTQQAKEAGII